MTESANGHPDRIDEIVNLLTGFIDETRQFMAEQKQFNTEQKQFNTEQKQFNTEQKQFNTEQKQFNARVTEDIGQLKGFHVRAVALQRTSSIARRLGLSEFHVLSHEEAGDLASRLADHGIEEHDRLSFSAADLIIEAHGEGRTKHYIAAEISYTANLDDVRRAVRNARYLQLLTGNDCYAAVIGCEKTADVDNAAANGSISWHYINNRAMAPA